MSRPFKSNQDHFAAFGIYRHVISPRHWKKRKLQQRAEKEKSIVCLSMCDTRGVVIASISHELKARCGLATGQDELRGRDGKSSQIVTVP
ncbi:hypothetical protein ALC62_14462 [Cyphomyrmex costatus]|uniref:Uncharacterized protein n=1 Tax=Cyphomyrmex costatus TaxID=456900 RepID=A0A195C1Z6_9HYME|nr:hypothetical protein ALC62_14462 [Cyphomyrmex costatus]